jgi:hypothetical protein
MLIVKTPIMLPVGYVDWVYPWRIAEGVPYLMLGDHNAYSPVKFVNTI